MADVSITPSNVVPGATTATTHVQPPLTAGEAIDAGNIVCVLVADGKAYKADANDTTKRDVRGMAGSSAVAAGQRVDIIPQSPATVVGTHGVAVGTPLFLSNTPGKLCPLADLASGSLPILCAFSNTTTALQIVLAVAGAPIP